MEEHINKVVKLYSGDKPMGLFAERLESNLNRMNAVYDEIVQL